jgi:hypothetical protein
MEVVKGGVIDEMQPITRLNMHNFEEQSRRSRCFVLSMCSVETGHCPLKMNDYTKKSTCPLNLPSSTDKLKTAERSPNSLN